MLSNLTFLKAVVYKVEAAYNDDIMFSQEENESIMEVEVTWSNYLENSRETG